jgi:hypothetical protein
VGAPTASDALPVLVTVRDCAAVVVPTTDGPKFKLVGARLIAPGASPFPLRLAVSGLPAMLPGCENVPGCAPVADG